MFTGLTFDQFVLSNNIVAAHAFLRLPNTEKALPSRYFLAGLCLAGQLREQVK